jgi:exopolysaccharide biosynthesis polyprenyl glycosylphosphotransferase
MVAITATATTATAAPAPSGTVAHDGVSSALPAIPAVDRRHALLPGLVAVDAIALTTAFVLAYAIRFRVNMPLLEVLPERAAFYSWVAVWAVPLWLGLLALYRLYDRRVLFSGPSEYGRVINACTVGTIAIVVVSFLDVRLVISRGWLLLTWLLSISLVNSGRFSVRRVLRALRRRGWLVTPTVIVGANEEAIALAEQFLGDPGSGTRVVGFVDGNFLPGTPMVGSLEVLGDPGDLKDIMERCGAREIVVATTALERKELLELYRAFGQDEAVEVRMSSGLFEILTTGVSVQEVGCVPLMTPQRVRITGVDAVLKSALDYIGAAAGLLLLGPVLLLLGALVALDSPGPALYRRRVLGRGGKPFDAFKFRTMVVDAERVLAADAALRQAFEQNYKLRNDPRVTRLGSFLRRTSLDELPQLVNVLRGEMSLVGPRMIAPDEAGRYGKWQLNLLTVKPGITGPWQIQGRSDIPYEERVRLSMRYIRNYSIWHDLEILLRTVLVVLRRRGAY